MSLYLRFLLPVCYSVFHLLLLSNGQMMAKTFQVTRAPNGTELCAVDPPSTEFNVSELNGALVNIGTAPLKALCGWKCTKDLSCTSFNWRDDIQVCEVYYYEPTTCSVENCCAFYQMKENSGRCQLSEQTTTTSSGKTTSVATKARTSTFTIPTTTEPTTARPTSSGKTTSVATTAITSTFTIPTTTVCGKFMIQQNCDNSTDFFRRSWAEYKIGFGNTSGDYWIGNDRLYQLTTVYCKCSADFYAINTVGIWYYRSYKDFSVADEATLYKLTAKGPGGNGSDSLNHQLTRDFSTYDVDNDSDNARNCADLIGSGWWFGDDNNPAFGSTDKCGKTNINANATFFAFGGNPVVTLQRSVAYITCV